MSEFSISNSIPKVGNFNSASGMEFKKLDKSDLGAQDSSKSFSSFIDQSLKDIEASQIEADTAVKDLATGKNKNLHQVMLTLEKADTTLKLGMQIRNKIVEAYKEIMRMQV